MQPCCVSSTSRHHVTHSSSMSNRLRLSRFAAVCSAKRNRSTRLAFTSVRSSASSSSRLSRAVGLVQLAHRPAQTTAAQPRQQFCPFPVDAPSFVPAHPWRRPPDIGRRSITSQRLTMVGSNRLRSVAVTQMTTWAGGSSSVFRILLEKLALRHVRVLNEEDLVAAFHRSQRSVMDQISRGFDAQLAVRRDPRSPSESVGENRRKSGCAPFAISLHDRHSPHGASLSRAQKRLCEGAHDGRLAHLGRPDEQIGVAQSRPRRAAPCPHRGQRGPPPRRAAGIARPTRGHRPATGLCRMQ